ncbi:CTP synthase 1-B-like [Penaeus indicus]|uniref:CTP synthase 1-B-like n=1 Tax=Penaeus indicus TaxID=29960 RepID=UPI00300CF55C
MQKWHELSTKHEHLQYSVSIVLVGNHTDLEDSYTSMIKALQHAALACNRKLDLKCLEAQDLEEDAKAKQPVKCYEAWKNVCKADGIIVPGGFSHCGMEGKVSVCKWAKTKEKPLSGICLGLQAAVIEYSRFEVNPKCDADLEAAGMKSVGCDVNGERMEILELADHPYYVTCQSHPEYLTRPLKPSPPYLGLILASSGKLEQYLSRGCRMSPTDSPESSVTDEELPMPPHLLAHQADKPSMPPASRATPPPLSEKRLHRPSTAPPPPPPLSEKRLHGPSTAPPPRQRRGISKEVRRTYNGWSRLFDGPQRRYFQMFFIICFCLLFNFFLYYDIPGVYEKWSDSPLSLQFSFRVERISLFYISKETQSCIKKKTECQFLMQRKDRVMHINFFFFFLFFSVRRYYSIFIFISDSI